MELAFERRFREWARETGCGWSDLRYPCGGEGESIAIHLTPPLPPRGIVVQVHGAGNDAMFGLVGTFKALLLRGFEVFSFDLPGHGRRSTTRFDHAAAAASVEDAVDRCGGARRGLPVHVAGVSLGGSILLGALPRISPRPASAALFCAPLRISMSGAAIRREIGPGLLRTVWRERQHFGLGGLIPSFGPFKRDTYPLRLAASPAPGPFGYVQSLNAALDSLRLEDAASRTDLPVLLVYGGRDLLVPAEQGHRLAALLPDAELMVLPKESHLTTPLAPAALRVWLERLEARTPPGGNGAPGKGPGPRDGEAEG